MKCILHYYNKEKTIQHRQLHLENDFWLLKYPRTFWDIIAGNGFFDWRVKNVQQLHENSCNCCMIVEIGSKPFCISLMNAALNSKYCIMKRYSEFKISLIKCSLSSAYRSQAFFDFFISRHI